MYQRWNIPRNVCFQYPITRDTTDLFVGREEHIKLLKSRLTKNSVLLLEGIIGVGKTSFGNFVRFTNKDQFTPTIEIRSDANWDKEDFLLNIIAVIIDEIENGKTYHINKKDKRLEEIINKYKDFFINTYNFGIGGGVTGFAQGNLNVGKSKSFSRSSHSTGVQFESDLKELANIINKNLKTSKPIIIQINNLDLDDGFSQDQMKTFFDTIRDLFLFENFAWILTGKTGIYDFLKLKVKKTYEIVTHIEIESLSEHDLVNIFEKRIEFEGYNGSIPLEPKIIQKIYHATGGSFRKTFVLIDELLSFYESVPMKNIITENDVAECFKIKKLNDFNKIQKKENWVPILRLIKNKPGISQQEILKIIQKSQPYISKQLKELLANQICRIIKNQQTHFYYLNDEYAFLTF